MSLLNLRAGLDKGAPAEETVRRFFTELGAGKLDSARRLAAPEIDWFGKKLGVAEWSGEKLRAFMLETKISVSKVRTMSAESVQAMPKHAVVRAFGPLQGTDTVVFADVTRGGTTTTVIAIVSSESSRPLLRRVLDPEAFTSFVEFAAICHVLNEPS